MLRLKKATGDTPKQKVNWDELANATGSPTESTLGAAASPPTSWLDDRDMPMYGAAPLEQYVPIVRCQECEKPILASALSTHKSNCEKIRKLNGKDAAGSKRKAEDENTVDTGTGPPKKKTKKELAKAAGTKRIKGPTHLDKHCCVINEKQQPCSRSITCKVHSMVAKRAVVGRSKPYDELLLDWKRENIVGFVEPVKRETKAERKAKKEAEKEAKRQEMLAAGIVPGQKKPKAPKGEGKKAKKTEKAAPGEKPTKKAAKGKDPTGANDEDEDDEAVDSEVEFESLVKAVRAARPYTAVPLARPSYSSNFFVARNEILRNCFDTMGFALSGSNLRGHAMGIVGAG